MKSRRPHFSSIIIHSLATVMAQLLFFYSPNFFLFLAIFLQYFLVFVGVRTLQMDMSTPNSRPLLPYPEDLKSGKDIE